MRSQPTSRKHCPQSQKKSNYPLAMDVNIVALCIVDKIMSGSSIQKGHACNTVMRSKVNVQQCSTTNDLRQIFMCSAIRQVLDHNCALFVAAVVLFFGLGHLQMGKVVVILVHIRQERGIVVSTTRLSVGHMRTILPGGKSTSWGPTTIPEPAILSFRWARDLNGSFLRSTESHTSGLSILIYHSVVVVVGLPVTLAIDQNLHSHR
jgi:hypothetical protein